MAVTFAVAGGGLDTLVRASPEWADPATTPIEVGAPGEGFDGQFYYRQAAAPLSGAERVEGIAFDLPALRSARVAYPVLAGALAAGTVGALPLSLVVVNVAAAGAVAGSGAVLARLGRRSPWWGLALLAFPGFVYTLGLDLAELVEAAATLVALVALRRNRTLVATAGLCLAVLTRETALALPLGVLGVALVSFVGDRSAWRPPRPAMVAAGSSLLVFGAWQYVIWARFGEVPLLGSADKNIRLPFAGLLAQANAFSPTSGEGLFRIGSLAAVVVVVVVAAAPWLGRPQHGEPAATPERSYEVGALMVAIAVGTLMSSFVWAGATSFMRGLTHVWLLAVVVTVTRPQRRGLAHPALLAAALGGTAVTFAAELSKRI